MSNPNLQQVLAFLTSDATEHELDVVVDAVRGRRAALANVAAAAIRPGITARTKSSLSPRYLTGLVGEVTEIKPGRRGKAAEAKLLLDEDSSKSLDLHPGARNYYVPDPGTGRRTLRVRVTGLEPVS